METLQAQLEKSDRSFDRRACSLVYEGYIEFLDTDEFPYNASVIRSIAEKHGLPIPVGGRYDHQALVEFGDPLLLQLQHEEYLAGKQHRFDELLAQEARGLAAGLVPISSIRPVAGMRIEYDKKVYRLKPGRHGGWAMLPPGARTKGISFSGLVSYHEAFEKCKDCGVARTNIERPVLVRVSS